ncbi:hypothetical protein J6590_015682 [Homalodisca vitripennis]|nr:hypothetical protein J6590_015682 [Homalodisca vitripennis]
MSASGQLSTLRRGIHIKVMELNYVETKFPAEFLKWFRSHEPTKPQGPPVGQRLEAE